MTKVTYAGLSDRGRIRPHNEDNWFAKPELGIFGVSDGMGGHQSGALASKIVVETLPSLLAKVLKGKSDLSQPGVVDEIRAAFIELSDALRNQSQHRPGLDGMGATIVVAVVRPMHTLIAHMGDSRAYLLRQGELSRLTRDHTMVQLLVEAGELTSDQAAHHPRRSSLTRYVGMESESLPEARLCPELVSGDRLLLCSDGLTGMLGDEQIARLLGAHSAPRECCAALIDAANQAGGQDNITAVIMAIEP